MARKKGERTLEEKKDLEKDMDEAAKRRAVEFKNYETVKQSIKKLEEDLRSV